MTTERTIAVVLAGGVGTRVGLGIPKQLIRIAGKAIVEHTLESLNENDLIDEILVMMNTESLHELDHLVGQPRFAKLRAILPGGSTRNETTRLALEALPADPSVKVLFHDAVRPFIDDRIIGDCVRALDDYDAVDTAIPSADTVIQVDDGLITDIPVRSRLRRGQTPQGFRLGTIRRAYAIAASDPAFAATDRPDSPPKSIFLNKAYNSSQMVYFAGKEWHNLGSKTTSASCPISGRIVLKYLDLRS